MGTGDSHSESLITDHLKRHRIDSQLDVVRDRHRGSHKRLRGTDCFQISLIGKQYNTALFEKQENTDTNVPEQKRRKEGAIIAKDKTGCVPDTVYEKFDRK